MVVLPYLEPAPEELWSGSYMDDLESTGIEVKDITKYPFMLIVEYGGSAAISLFSTNGINYYGSSASNQALPGLNTYINTCGLKRTGNKLQGRVVQTTHTPNMVHGQSVQPAITKIFGVM